MRAVFRDYGHLLSMFEDANVNASRIMLEFLQSRKLDLFTKGEPVKWVPGWLAKGLEAAQRMCILMGTPITADSILKAIPFKDAAVLHFAKTHYPEIGPELFKRITNVHSNYYSTRPDWEAYSDAFHAELMELKPRGWIYDGNSLKFRVFRRIYVLDLSAMKRFSCSWIDWQQLGMQAPMEEEHYCTFTAKEMVIAPEGKAEPMQVKWLYLVHFKSKATYRLYAADAGLETYQPTVVKAGLQGKRIMPPAGTVIRYEHFNIVPLDKSYLFD